MVFINQPPDGKSHTYQKNRSNRSFFKLLSYLRSFRRGRLPGQLVIQYSNHCNADCPQCGMRRSANIPRHVINKERAKYLIDSAAENGVKALSLTGGEPLLFQSDIIELINHAIAAGIPYVRTGTNGFLFRNSDKAGYIKRISTLAETLAETDLYTFWISLDSVVPEDHESLRGLEGVVRGIEKALPVFHDHGIYPAVNLGINRATGGRSCQSFLHDRDTSPDEFFESFKTAFSRFYHFVADLGFTTVNSCYPMSDNELPHECESSSKSLDKSIYGALSSDTIISFSPAEKTLIFRALLETIPKFRGRLRIFSPRCSLHSLMRKFADQRSPLFPCRGGEDFFFADCENGMLHPCGYRQKPMSRFPDLTRRSQKSNSCDLCEWECFRDPSDLLGPFSVMFSQPHLLPRYFADDPKFFRLLVEDLRYYHACDYFNGRRPPKFAAMKKYASFEKA